MKPLFALALLPTILTAQNYTISTLAGWSGNSYVARIQNGPNLVAVDRTGNTYTSAEDGSLFKLTPDLIPSRLTRTPQATALAITGAGDLYLTDSQAIQIIKVSPEGTQQTIPLPGLKSLAGMAIDYAGTFYLTDPTANLIYRFTPGTTPQIIAGIGGPTRTSSGDGGPALGAALNSPYLLAIDELGALYFTEAFSRIRRISPTGTITTVAGTGVQGHSGDGGPATKAAIYPSSLAADFAGNLYFSEAPIFNNIRRVDRNGILTTVAGRPEGLQYGTGDNVPALNQPLQWPGGIAPDNNGNLFFGDKYSGRLYKIDTTGTLHTIFGMLGGAFWGDGGPATLAGLNTPSNAVTDARGNTYEIDNGRIRRISPQGIISTILKPANLKYPYSLALDPAGTLYLSTPGSIQKLTPDGTLTSFSAVSGFLTFSPQGTPYVATGNSVVTLDSNGIPTRIAGSDDPGFSGDGGPALQAKFSRISSLAADASGNLFVCDASNVRVRRISPDGIVQTVAGGGPPNQDPRGASYSWVPATTVFMYPESIAVDPAGNLFIYSNVNIFEVFPDGLLLRIAGDGKQGYRGDGGPASAAEFIAGGTISADPSGNLYIADGQANAIRVLRPAGPPVTIGRVFPNGPYAPGEIITLSGNNLGPARFVSADPTQDLSSTLAGTTVTVGGIPAPLLYTSSSEISLQLPFELAGNLAEITVQYNGLQSAPVKLSLAPVTPVILSSGTSGTPVIFNQDGSRNAFESPARPGSVLTLFLTGFGQTNPPSVTGQIATAAGSPPEAAVTARFDQQPATITYIGVAPGLSNGVTQINVRLSESIVSYTSLLLFAGTGLTTTGIYVAPN